MSSSSSVNTLQRLVEQLKLEAGVERIRPIIIINSSGAKLKYRHRQVYACFLHAHKHLSVRSLRQLQSFSSIVCRTLAKMLCSLEFRLEATHFESPDPAHCSEDGEGFLKVLKYKKNPSGLPSFPNQQFLYVGLKRFL